MAEATTFRNNALPYPVYGVAFVVVFPLLDADGDPISPSSPDSERSLNGDTFADCTNEATEIATSSGVCYLVLTAAEMTADIVAVRIQSTGAKTTILTLYPRKLPILATGTCQGANDTGDIQLASGDSAVDDYYNGCLIVAVIDTVTEARLINDYVGSTKVAEIAPAWNTAAPDSNDTYTIYLPEGRQVGSADVKAWLGTTAATPTVAGVPEVDVTHWRGTAAPAEHTSGYPIVTIKDGTGTGEINTNAGAIALVDLVTTTTTTTTATNVTTVNGLAAGVITATSIAADAITAAKIAADVSTEIRSLASGTSDSGSTTTMVDAARTEADTDYWKGMLIVFTSGTIAGQARVITAFDAATDTITFAPATTATVGTQTYEIWPVGDFLRPTTSGRTLDVSAGGEAGVDWANVGSPTTTVGLSGTTVKTATDVETDTQDIQARLPAALTAGGNMKSDVLAVSGDTTAADNLELAFDDTAGAVPWTNVVDQGTAQSATSTTLVLRSAAAFADDELIGARILITGGSAGVGQSRLITDYVSATDTATVSTWTTTPTGTITYKIFGDTAAAGGSAPTAAEVADAVWDEAQSGHTTAGTFGRYLDAQVANVEADTQDIQSRLPAALVGGRIDANVGAISSDATAADNAEAFFDGTGYAGTNNVIPLVTTTTTATNVTTVNGLAAGVITAASIAADAITDAKVASDVTIASVTGSVGSVTGAVGSVTATVNADVVSISGDSAAADNLEKEYDGTGYGQILQRTTIATLASQTSFTLTAGSADNDAYNGCIIVIEDASTAAQKAVAVVDDYTGATKTIALRTDPAVFTMATTDIVTIIADKSLKPTVDFRTLDVSSGGEAGVDWANVGTPGSTVSLSATTVATVTTYTGNTPQTGDAYAIVNSGTHGNAAIKGYVDDIGTAGAGLTAIPWNAAWDAEVQSEAEDALAAVGVTTTVTGRIDAAISSRMATYTQPTGFLAATFPTTVASTTNITAGTITTATNVTNAPTSGDLTTTMKASINTEVLDVLSVDTFAELSADPGASPTVVKALMLLYMALRNKVDVDATTKEIHNNAGSVLLTKALTDNGTTYSEAKMS